MTPSPLSSLGELMNKTKPEWVKLIESYEKASGETVEAGLFATIDTIVEKQIKATKREVLERVRKYWHHAGEWHNAECDFILFDHGNCSCDNQKIKKELEE